MGDQHALATQQAPPEPASDQESSPRAKKPSRVYYPRHAMSITGEGAPDGPPLSRGTLLFLQRTIGNRAVAQLLQRKARLSQPDDAYEQEADRVAERVVRMPAQETTNHARTVGSQLRRFAPPQGAELQRRAVEDDERERPEEEGAAQMKRDDASVSVQREGESGLPPVPNVRLTPPSILQPPQTGLPPSSEYRFRLSPEVMALVRAQATERVLQVLDPERIRAALAQSTPAAGPLAPGAPSPSTSPTAPAATPTVPSPTPPLVIPGPAAVSFGVVWAMITADPSINQLALNAQSEALNQLGRLSTAERVGLISVTATMVGSVGVLASDPRYRGEMLDAAFRAINGSVIRVPGTPARLEFNWQPGRLMLGLHFDLGSVLPAPWGFSSIGFLGPNPMAVPPPPMPPLERSAEPGANDLPPTPGFEQLGQRVLAASSGGSSLNDDVRDRLEEHLGVDLSDVKLHTDGEADQLARSISAVAFTTGPNIFMRAGAYNPDSPEGMRLLAHETVHTQQQADGPVDGTPTPGGVAVSHPSDRFEQEAEQIAEQFGQQSPQPPRQIRARAEGRPRAAAQHRSMGGKLLLSRETAQEVRDRFTNWGGLNLQEEALGQYLLAQYVRTGRYQFVHEVINLLEGYNRDDVAGEIMSGLSTREIIRIGRDANGVNMLRLMKDELGDVWGTITEGERHQADLLGAVLNDPGQRNLWNRERIGHLKDEAGSDLEALARVFEDDEIIDDESVQSRLQSVLGATEHIAIPGLQTGIEFSDVGFAGDQNPGGAGFRDPHPSSRNQVGHFLTAVGLEFSPGVVSRPIPYFGSVRSMVGAPASMSDADVALRLTIGHEKAPDPNATMAAINVALTGILESLRPGPEGETDEERDRRVGQAVIDETQRQINEIIAAFRTQFQAATDADVQAWNEALGALGTGDALDLGAAEAPLSRIQINPQNRGNSIQDMRLSLVGWRLGQLISSGAFGDDRARVAAWIRTNLGPRP
jgi:hypothetical protein